MKKKIKIKIIDKNNNLRFINILRKNINKYEIISKIGNRYIYQKKIKEKIIKKEIEEIIKEKQYIRIWFKFKYTKKNPLFIEAHIDGLEKDEKELKDKLWEFIASNFNETIARMGEMGIEYVDNPEDIGDVKYKNKLTQKWKQLKLT